MNNEKVKEIKKILEMFTIDNKEMTLFQSPVPQGESCIKLIKYADILSLINELESENKELKKYKLNWLNSEKMHLQAEMEETEFELASSNRLFEIVSKENQQLKNRIAELEEKYSKKLTKRHGVDITND